MFGVRCLILKGLIFDRVGLVRCTRHMSAFDFCGLGVSRRCLSYQGYQVLRASELEDVMARFYCVS